jgi:proline iminopeptidase
MADNIEDKQIGDTFITTVGSGDPLVVVHGGAGLDHSYLVHWLSPLENSRQLVFYDQRGCGRDRTSVEDITALKLVDQFIELARRLQNGHKVGVLTHSWGAYILYEALRRAEDLDLREIVMCSPVGLTRERFDQSGERLVSRIPENVLSEIEGSEKANDGVGVMRAALPYYVANPNSTPPISFGFYDPAVFARVVETLNTYDCRDIADRLPASTVLIYGEADIELPSATEEIHGRASVAMIDKAGHFPFAEQPQAFLGVVESFLTGS